MPPSCVTRVSVGGERNGYSPPVISNVFTVDPWTVHEPDLDVELLGQTESLFALANGHVGMRGNLDEGEPHRMPGTYLNSFFESAPAPVRRGRATASRSGSDAGQRPQRQAHPAAGRRRAVRRPLRAAARPRADLDMRAGILRRDGRWTSPADSACGSPRTRLVSFTQRAVAAISYEVRDPSEDAESDAARRAVGAGRQRADAPGERRSARRGGPRRTRWCPRSTRTRTTAPVLIHQTRRSRAARGGGHGPPGRRPGRHADRELRARADVGRPRSSPG